MKKIVTLLLTVLFLAVATVPAFAQGNVTYDQEAQQFIFEPGSDHSPTDLFTDFKGVMPGDVLSQKILVKNKGDREIKVKIYLRALGAQEGSEDFLSQMTLQVQADPNDPTAYLFDAAADQPAQLTDWVYLGTLYYQGEMTLDVTLTVPVEMGNDYQNQIGALDWEFKIEELPLEPGDPKPPPTSDFKWLGWAIGAAAAVALVVIVIFLRKRNNDDSGK